MKKPLLHPTSFGIYQCQKKAIKYLENIDINVLFGRMLDACKEDHVKNFPVSIVWHSSPDYSNNGRLSFNEGRQRFYDLFLGHFGPIHRDSDSLSEELILFEKFIIAILSYLRERVKATRLLLSNHAERHGKLMVIRDNHLITMLNCNRYTYDGTRAVLAALETIGIETENPFIVRKIPDRGEFLLKVDYQVILVTDEYENIDWLTSLERVEETINSMFSI